MTAAKMLAAAVGIACFMLLVFDCVGGGNVGLEPRILVEKQDICRHTLDGILAKTAMPVVESLQRTAVNISPTSLPSEFVTREGEATAVNMFPMSLPKQFIAREGEAPAEPLHRWLGRSLALPKVFTGIDFAKMFGAMAFNGPHCCPCLSMML